MAFIEMQNMKITFPRQLTGLMSDLLSRTPKAPAPQAMPKAANHIDARRWRLSERREHEAMGALRAALYSDDKAA